MKNIVFIIGIFAYTNFCYAQKDSIKFTYNTNYLDNSKNDYLKIQPISSTYSTDENHLLKNSIVPVILFGATAATWNNKEDIRDVRNRYIPSFKASYDDYLQYAPAVAVYGLQLAGVKGRNNIKRATLSHASSLAIMGIIVNVLKKTTKIQRPDESANNSFPSGHTAMAFTNASFLHKEYGVVNTAYSIGGYSAATLTGLGRNLNNRHWVSDVLAGAGIGILSTELGYFFIDKFYKNKGDNIGLLSKVEGNDNPSFLALKAGPTIPITYFIDDRKDLGFEMGLEGAYYFSKNFGLGGEFGFTSFPIRSVKLDIEDNNGLQNVDMNYESLGFLNLSIGPYFSHSFSDKWEVSLKATAGISNPASGKIILEGDIIDTPNNKLDIVSYTPSTSFRRNYGGALTYKFKPELGLTLFSDFSQINTKIKYEAIEELIADEDDVENITEKEKIKFVTLGLRVTAYF